MGLVLVVVVLCRPSAAVPPWSRCLLAVCLHHSEGEDSGEVGAVPPWSRCLLAVRLHHSEGEDSGKVGAVLEIGTRSADQH